MKLKPKPKKEKDFGFHVYRHFAFPFPVRKKNGSGWWLEHYYSASVLKTVTYFLGTKDECEAFASELNQLSETDTVEYFRLKQEKSNCDFYAGTLNALAITLLVFVVVAFAVVVNIVMHG